MAQDPHWSMIQWNPVYLNPANTGSGPLKNRVIGEYRSQWRAIPVPFNSTFFSYDGRVIDHHLKAFRLGVGGNFLFDQSGDGVLRQFIPQVALSFGKPFNYGKQCVSIGIQGGLGFKTINLNNLKFVNQYNGVTYDPNIASGEQFNGESARLGLFSMGVNFNTALKTIGTLDWGAAVWNPHTPKYEFLSSSNDELPMRINTYLKTEIKLGTNKLGAISPSFFYQHQSKSNEYLAQILGSYTVKSNVPVKLSIGGGYRINDAIMGCLGVDWKNLQLGFSMDGNISELKKGTNGRGAYEVLLTYSWEKKKKEILDTLLMTEQITEPEPEKPIEIVVKKDTIKPIVVQVPEVIPAKVVEEKMVNIYKILPIVLYFDNDQPSSAQINNNYSTLYQEYKLNESKYFFYNDNGREFFTNNVDKGYKNLFSALDDILFLMEKGQTLELDIKGYASPLGNSLSNKLISENRVIIIENEILNFKNGALKPFINSGKLTLNRISLGEEKASTEVVNIQDREKAIYSIEAANERRVEIIAIELR